MLYQPTNISPSMTGALGNGVIDANNNLTVSWQVNGNSPMTAFQITIYANNAISTQLFSTGKLTYGCPFYGVDYAGNVQMFNYTIYHEQDRKRTRLQNRHSAMVERKRFRNAIQRKCVSCKEQPNTCHRHDTGTVEVTLIYFYCILYSRARRCTQLV